METNHSFIEYCAMISSAKSVQDVINITACALHDINIMPDAYALLLDISMYKISYIHNVLE